MIYPRSNRADGAAVAAHYDELDRFYRTVWGTHLHHGYWQSGDESTEEAILNLSRLVATLARITAGSRVCDFGCGYGATARFFAQEYGAHVTGMTISRRQHELAQNMAGENVDFLLGDGLDNHLPACSFDALVAIESSEHIGDKPAFFQEAQRLLRPDGRLVVAAWLAREQATPFEARFLLEPICAEGRLPSMATASEYLAMFKAGGFREPRVRRSEPQRAQDLEHLCLPFDKNHWIQCRAPARAAPTRLGQPCVCEEPCFAFGSPTEPVACATGFSPRQNNPGTTALPAFVER